MHLIKCLLGLFVVSLVGALPNPIEEASESKNGPRTAGLFLNSKTSKFAVKGNELPEVNFNIGESYAGTLPIGPSSLGNLNNLFFWFFPSPNPAAKKEIVIWLNGGPGCSSMQGVLQEHGPFLWQTGTFAPVANPYSWNKLTNVIYVDQPVGTGFSQGNIQVNNETDVARHFMGFWKNFVDTFSLQGYKIYLTGESYAGQYVPWIASAMLDNGNKTYFNVTGVQINDPLINYPIVMRDVPAVHALEKYNNVIGIDENTVAYLKAQADLCGFTTYLAQHTSNFPPSGPIPSAPSSNAPECNLWGQIVYSAYRANPCFNAFHVTDFCPYLWSELGFPTLGGGPNNYFNRSDVQRAIHAPRTNFFVCENQPNIFPNGPDTSLPSGLGPLASVINRTKNVIIAHGLLDYALLADGSLITIQNMTWGGLQGFRTAPSPTSNFFVPFHSSLDTIWALASSGLPNPPPQYDTAGAGLQGVTHSERGLTFVTVNLAGHFIPQYTPGASYRQLEFLLGRISSLEEQGPYTTG